MVCKSILLPPDAPFAHWLAEFKDHMEAEQGLSQVTIHGRCWNIRNFLAQLPEEVLESGFGLADIEAFIKFISVHKKYAKTTLQLIADCLRAFCRFASTRGWCAKNLAEGIRSPRVYSLSDVPIGPSWEDVNRLPLMVPSNKPTDIRARAILMLLTAYGLRAGEVKGLMLDDFDWARELLTVSCTKTRQKRIFPLSHAVGEAVLLYLKSSRPRSMHRELFLTVCGKPINDIYMIISPLLIRLGVDLPHYGPHAIRHAYATHLLAEGFSLKQIGDQLGHQDVETTRIYAKADVANLRKVADINLRGLL